MPYISDPIEHLSTDALREMAKSVREKAAPFERKALEMVAANVHRWRDQVSCEPVEDPGMSSDCRDVDLKSVVSAEAISAWNEAAKLRALAILLDAEIAFREMD